MIKQLLDWKGKINLCKICKHERSLGRSTIYLSKNTCDSKLLLDHVFFFHSVNLRFFVTPPLINGLTKGEESLIGADSGKRCVSDCDGIAANMGCPPATATVVGFCAAFFSELFVKNYW